jgi:autotransporter-associated beta strand protein
VRSGGQRIAELLIYGKLLSETERLSVEAYLTAKWFSRPYAGYNGRASVASVRLTATNEIAVAENETLSLTTVWGGEHQGRTVKSGAGTLELADAAGFGGTLTWMAGDLAVPRRAVPNALPTNPVFRVDASVAGSLDTVADANGALRITAWRDADGRAFAASSFYATNRPTLMTNALNGRTVVDFGAYASGQFLQWNTNMSYIGTVLWVVGAQNGGGNLMGHSSDNNCHFQRGGTGGSQTSPLWSLAGIKVAMRACPTYINGVRVNGTNAYLGYGYHVVAVQTPGAFANQFAGHLSTTNDLSRTGGQRLAEVVAYNRLLTDQELADAQAYLMRKWLNADAPGYVRQSRSRPDLQDLDAEGSGNLTVANNTVRIGALSGNGSFTKTGDGDLEVTSLSNFVGAVAVQGGNLRIVASSVTNNVPADEPIFRLDASRADSLEMFAQNGTNFIAQWTDVSGWRNAARRWDTSASRPLPWLRTDDPANGLPAVDFGPRASCRALVFDKPVKNIRAAYLVVGTQNGCGNFLLGSTGSEGTYDFHRGGDDTTDLLTRPIIATYAPCQPLRDGLIYIDGALTNANAGLSGSYQLVEFHPTAGMSASALACDRYSGLIDVGDLGSEGARRTGGQRLCEVILYDRPLSPRERTATRNYLMQKWLNRTPAALPSESTASTLRQLTASAATNISLRTENAISVTVLAGVGGVVKTGSATLSVVDASAFTGTVRVAEGVLELTGQPLATAPALPTDGLTFHVDATTNVEWTLTNGVRSVTRWVSTVGDGCYAYPPENKPEYKAGDLAGQPVVDLGAMGSLRHMLFVNPNATGGATGRITNIRSIFWVLGSQGGAGYLLGGGTNASNAVAHYNFHCGAARPIPRLSTPPAPRI